MRPESLSMELDFIMNNRRYYEALAEGRASSEQSSIRAGNIHEAVEGRESMEDSQARMGETPAHSPAEEGIKQDACRGTAKRGNERR